MSQSIDDDVLKIPASDSNSAASTSLRRKPKHRSDKPNEPEYEGGEDEHIDDDDDLH